MSEKQKDGGSPEGIAVDKLLGLGGLALLGILCYFVLRPFAPALLWAAILAFTLYPVQLKLTEWFKGRRSWAALAVTILGVLLVVGPVTLITLSLVDDGKKLAATAKSAVLDAPDEPPDWMTGVPVLGSEISDYWSVFVSSRQDWVDENVAGGAEEDVGLPPEGSVEEEELLSLAERAVTALRKVLVWAGGAVAMGLTQITISLFLVYFLLRDAEKLGERLGMAVDKMAGERGRRLLRVAGQTVKGVVYGFLGTSAAQALMAGIGFMIAGVPGAALLGTLTFFVAVIPVGPPVIWGGAAVWLYMENGLGWAIFMVVWGFFGISSVDNVLRPYLVSQGNKMPFALMFLGLIGGAVAFGLVGVFLGPTLLAVAFRLIDEWTSGKGEMLGADEEKV